MSKDKEQLTNERNEKAYQFYRLLIDTGATIIWQGSIGAELEAKITEIGEELKLLDREVAGIKLTESDGDFLAGLTAVKPKEGVEPIYLELPPPFDSAPIR